MTFYIVLWLVSFGLSFSGIFKGGKSPFKAIVYFVLVLAIFVAFRYEVGADWGGYVSYYYTGVAMDRDSGQMEPLFTLIRNICFGLNLPHTIFFYIVAVSSMIVICFAAKILKIKNYYIVFLIYISLFICNFQFNLVRNGVMASCAWMAFAYKSKNNLKFSLLWAIIASCFHLSGLIIFPLIFLVDLVIPRKMLLLLLAIASVCFVIDIGGTILGYFPILQYIDRFNAYMNSDDTSSYGLSFGLVFNITLLMYVYFRFWKEYKVDVCYRIIVNAFFFSIFLGLTFNNLGIVVARLGQSLNMATLFLWPYILANSKNGQNRVLVGCFFVVYLLLYYYRALGTVNELGENPNVPYQFELIQDVKNIKTYY